MASHAAARAAATYALGDGRNMSLVSAKAGVAKLRQAHLGIAKAYNRARWRGNAGKQSSSTAGVEIKEARVAAPRAYLRARRPLYHISAAN